MALEADGWLADWLEYIPLGGNSGQAARNFFQIDISGDSRSQPIYAAPRFFYRVSGHCQIDCVWWLLAGCFPEKIMIAGIAGSRRNFQL